MQVSESILKRCKKSDRKAQRELYDCLSSMLFGVCLRYAATRFEAEDFLQEAFIKIYNHLDAYKGDGVFEAWARRITVNVILKDFKKKNALKGSSDVTEAESFSSDLEGAISQINNNELLSFVNMLPEGKRVVFNLYAIEGYNHKEIGELLDISEGTSKSQLAKAKTLLKTIHQTYNKVNAEKIY